jgi:hypothetical protein
MAAFKDMVTKTRDMAAEYQDMVAKCGTGNQDEKRVSAKKYYKCK